MSDEKKDTLDRIVPDGDPVFMDILKRTMKESAIQHAKNCGASNEFIQELKENDDSMVITSVVDLIYGLPGKKEFCNE